jgi:predicted metalloprotease with PDZ domain
MSAPIGYEIRIADAAAHMFEVRVTIADAGGEPLRFAMPAWIPGSYVIRDYARNVIRFRAESDGRDVPVTKLDKSTWQVDAVDRALTVILDVFAHDDSVRGAHLDRTHAYFNGPAVFPSVVGHEHGACELTIVAPEDKFVVDWRVATSMRRNGSEQYGFGAYIADNYAELIDHPVEAGALSIAEFEAGGIPHAIAIRGRVRCDMARLSHDLKTLCEHHLDFLGVPEGFDRYLFLLNAPGKGYGGLEHRWSSSLVCARESLPRKGQEKVDEGYREFLGLASHEYFHLWNVKRMKPAAFSPYDLSGEAYTSLLWVYEGVTSYYDDLALLRSGLITGSDYLELVGRTITRVQRGPGRTRQSVAESSFDAWTKFYKQDPNAHNTIVSYYAKGSLIALALDLKLRQESGGAVSLDDVTRACWTRWGRDENGMPEDGFEAVCAELSGLDLADFFDANVRGTGELPLEHLLRGHGIELVMRRATGKDDKGGSKSKDDKAASAWLGARLAYRDGRSVFNTVVNGGPAEQAGVSPGDEAIALDGLRLTAANFDKRLRRARVNDRFDLVVMRGDELLQLKVRLGEAPADTCYLQLIEDVDIETETRRAAWLAG